MYFFATILLGAAFLCAILGSFCLIYRLATADGPASRESGDRVGLLNIPLTFFMTIASGILLYAFIAHDFRVEYVYSYSDLTLPLFYRITAFWAGQAGSMLFWAWSVAISGLAFIVLPAYKGLSDRTKAWYWLFFYCIMAFFLLLLLVWSNPFITIQGSVPADGRGLNPLLQNPGMIFHPPLLFLGYGGFVVPGCLALAQAMSGKLSGSGEQQEESWGQAARPFTLIAWSLLTAGIVLGAWWAYMELGWGGYWAWDPVENASLIPWLLATAYLHTGVIESRRGKLLRTNVFLMALTTISAFFATYLVRSGVVQSLHTFAGDSVGDPLIIFILVMTYISLVIALCSPSSSLAGGPKMRKALYSAFSLGALLLAMIVLSFMGMQWYFVALLLLVANLLHLVWLASTMEVSGRELEDLTSKEGLLLIVAWLLLAISFMILVATMWPVIINALRGLSNLLPAFISSQLPDKPMGLEPAFYNRACLPLFALFAVLLVVCPYRKWKLVQGSGGFYQPYLFLGALGSLAAILVTLWLLDIRNYVALVAASCSLAAIMGIFFFFSGMPSLMKVRSTLAAHGVHIGLLLMTLGIAFSGPYQVETTLHLAKGEIGQIGDYRLRLHELYEGESAKGPSGKPNYVFIEAEILVTDVDGKPLGKLAPQRRLYANFDQQTYAEVSTRFSLGNEIYATLLKIDEENKATLMVNINPLVNWLWIGGTLMCLFPFLGLRRVSRERESEGSAEKPLETPA